MESFHHFIAGVAGAFVAYFLIHRGKRWSYFWKDRGKRLNILLFDIGGYIACGGLVSLFIFSCDLKAAFIGGATWPGVVGAWIINKELEVRKTQLEILKVKLGAQNIKGKNK